MNDGPTSQNRVFLHGRLANLAVDRELPSGDVMTTFRLIVDRRTADRGRVDSLECTSTVARVRRSLAKTAPGDWLEVSGSLHRRFWRGPSGVNSRYAVQVATVRVTRRTKRPATDPAGGAGPSPTQASV